ncbi:MAG: SNF2 helicase associated domain-containing protein [Clostridia bacterium]|nr:SNF2 helicase associated domain-containing protein [Clostridia bacterium]
MTEEMLETLRRITPQEEYTAGLALYRAGGVHALEEENGMLRYVVDDNPRRVVRVAAGAKLSGRCSCDFFGNVHKPCRHLASAMMQAMASGAIEEVRRKRARENAAKLMSTISGALPMETPLEMEVTLQLIGNQPVRVALRVGQERMYVVKSMAQFLHALQSKETMAFGKGFVLEPEWMGFAGVNEKIIRVLQDAAYICQLEGKLVLTGLEAKWLPVDARYMPRLMQLLMAKPFKISFGEEVVQVPCVFDAQAELLFGVTQSGRELEVRAQMPKSMRPLDSQCRYVFCEGDVLRLPREQREIVRVMLESGKDGQAAFRFDAPQSARVISELLPTLERAGKVTLDGALAERIVRRTLAVKAYFDREERTVLSKIAFCYGDTEIDPFAPVVPKGDEDERVLMLRDAAGERAALDLLAKAGFRMQRGRVVLSGQEPIYRFLTEGIYEMQKLAEVYCSDEFRRLTPRKPHFTGMLRMQEGALQLELSENGEPAPEVLAILQALRDNKKYFRLKDGSFLDLTDMDEWRELADAAAGAKEEAPEDEGEHGRGLLEIQSFRVAYMMSLLEGGRLPVSADDSVQRFVESMDADGEPCPEPLGSMLRPYQLRGFMWMQALDRLNMGGILADDMGLGKTLQVISLLLWAKRRGGDRRMGGEKRPSIVVAPTSLVYNWMAEIKRFAPELSVVAGEGSQSARAQTIARLSSEDCDIDVYLTSYPLIRRDIGQLQNIQFRFAILDEAQYIKNAMSVGAGAVKQLRAKTRFALTGTPMENHPGELWSIFDFVLPGYLLSFAQFMHRFGTGEESDVLRRRIRPFLLRRLKGDMFRELPEKNEIQMMADMTEEQRRVYQASLLRLRPQVDTLLAGKNRIEVLAAITELRQICGHPSLVLPSYAASSGKLDMLLDILPGSLEAGHRALIFSQFTRMLKILQRRLEAEGIECMYLDGETPPKRRIELVDQFNGGKGQVFLISLKAGGSGLNLVGADTVIHFDPWWNPAAEDQATDRAHRIGQKHTVSVIRLITRGSIEEQVVKLGARKRELFDQMITAGEAMPTQLTQEDIRALFE